MQSVQTQLMRLLALALASGVASAAAQPTKAPRFEITVSPAIRSAPVTGRLVLVVSKTAEPEPRLAVAPQGPAIFGVDLTQLRVGQAAVVDTTSLGYPMQLSALPASDYYVQPVINVYEQVHRSD